MSRVGKEESPSAILVSAADKLANASAILSDYRHCGDDVWKRFNADAGKDGTIGYYRVLVNAYQATGLHPRLVRDLGIVVDVAEHFEEVVTVRIAELAQSVDARFDAVDARFDAVDAQFKEVARFDEVREHFGEMRDFTTFCFDKLRAEMRADFGRVHRRLDRHEELLSEVLKEVRALKPK